MNGRVPTPPKEPKPQARNHTRGATFPQASPRRGESPTSTLLPGFQKHFELALRPAWCTIFDIYFNITFFPGSKDFVDIFGHDEKCVFIKGDLVLFLTNIFNFFPGPKDFVCISGQDKKCLFIQYTIFEVYLNIKKMIYLFFRSEGFCWYIWS